ncbi:hypothetical protein FACS1894190_10210 [Spirochaetia bacterium]|nr:hypothetical protein FACS1894190_10210 [Spirochaetia bacterium]
MKTITVGRLIQSVRRNSDLTISDATYLVSLILDLISESLSKGENVKLRGLGTFEVNIQKARNIKSPIANKSIFRPERKVVRFKPSGVLKKSLQKNT